MKLIYISERYNKINLPSHIREEIIDLFKDNGISRYYNLFINNIELLPLVANLLNDSAKRISNSYYDYKYSLIKLIAEQHPRTWIDEKEGVVFFETPYGQVSFHVDRSTIEYVKQYSLNSYERDWDGKDNQSKALSIIDKVIEDLA